MARQGGCISRGLEFIVGETALSARHFATLEEVHPNRGAEVRAKQENCKVSSLIIDEKFVVDDGELEDGQLPGEWSGGEESQEDCESAQTLEGSAAVSSVVRAVPIIPTTVNVADQIYYPFQAVVIPSELRRRGNDAANGKKKKHKKGKGSKKRSQEKANEKYNELLKNRKVDGKFVDDGSNQPALRKSKDNPRGEPTLNDNGTGKFKKVPENLPQATSKKPTVDEGPEDGEIRLDSTKIDSGILSTLVEDEVGLWTTDIVDDQFITEMERDGAAVKKKRGPETAERRLRRTIAKRKKRAQKERELGIRRPLRTTQSKPVKVLCKFYMKGLCSKGNQCTYSHDAVPVTKLELCKFFVSHSCLKGDDCPYSHNLRAFPCKFFHTRGLCYDGENCRFSHRAISEAALGSLKERVEKEKKEKIGNTSPFDSQTPSFSTQLPPELDPDPWGWRTSSTYSNHEKPIQHTNLTIPDQSTHFDGDFNPGKHASASSAVGIMSGQSMDFSSSTDMKDTKFDAMSPIRIVEKGEECKYMQANNTEAMESGKPVHQGGLERGAELPLPMVLQSTGAPYNSTMPGILKMPVCSSPSNEQSNAREVLEASRMERKMDAGQSILEEPSIKLCVHSSMVSPLAGKLVAPLLRGRQLGSLVVEHDKNQLFSFPVESNGQRKVESLLAEALGL